MNQPLSLAVVGCGAVTQLMHLPALSQTPEIAVRALVDVNHQRLKKLSQVYGIAQTYTDYQALPETIQAVLIALPNHLHAPVSTYFLRRGMHVYVEKPMALTPAESATMLLAAEQSGATLAVGMMRRAYPAMQFIQRCVAVGALGPIQRVIWHEGYTAGWETTSDFIVRPEQAGGGVFTDLGAHILDMLLWWFGSLIPLTYADDALGGLEANCQATLGLPGGATAQVELSRSRTLSNTVRLEGQYATLSAGVQSGDTVSWVSATPTAPMLVGYPQGVAGPTTQRAALITMFRDFAQAIAEKRAPLVPGMQGQQNVDIIQRCYSLKQYLPYPWERDEQ